MALRRKALPRPGNRLLAALPADDYARLFPHLKRVDLELNQTLYAPDARIRKVYFPETGVVSVTSRHEDGTSIEVATIGNEAMIGLPAYLGGRSFPLRAFVQIAGEAWALPAERLQREVRTGGPLQQVLALYTQAFITQIAQAAACNRLHALKKRCARWLLMTDDRVAGHEFPMTQRFLGQMLGVRRASVNVAAGMLQKAGLITYTRGTINVVDRPGLEQAACACYAIIRDEFARLIPPNGQTPA